MVTPVFVLKSFLDLRWGLVTLTVSCEGVLERDQVFGLPKRGLNHWKLGRVVVKLLFGWRSRDSDSEQGLFVRTAFLIIIDQIAKKLFQRVKPHPEKCSQLCKAINIAREVCLTTVTDHLRKFSGKIVAIVPKGVVVLPGPKGAEVLSD